MIDWLVKSWEEKKDEIRDDLTKLVAEFEELGEVGGIFRYVDIVEIVVGTLFESNTTIAQCDTGVFAGDEVFVFGFDGSVYVVAVKYGSCDTLKRIFNGPQGRWVDDLMTLALHIVQKTVLLESVKGN